MRITRRGRNLGIVAAYVVGALVILALMWFITVSV